LQGFTGWPGRMRLPSWQEDYILHSEPGDVFFNIAPSSGVNSTGPGLPVGQKHSQGGN